MLDSSDSLVLAKEELTIQLCNHLYAPLYQGLRAVWNDAKRLSLSDPDHPSVLKNFQERLALIPKWNQDIIDQEFARVLSESEATSELYDKLIQAVFLANVRSLCAISIRSKLPQINIKVPPSKVFIHKCYIRCARDFFSNPELFEDRVGKVIEIDGIKYQEPKIYDPSYVQQNLQKIVDMIVKSIQRTIRDLIPLQYILNECLTIDKEDEPENQEDAELRSNSSSKTRRSKVSKHSKKQNDNERTDRELLEKDLSSLQNPEKLAPPQEPETKKINLSGEAVPVEEMPLPAPTVIPPPQLVSTPQGIVQMPSPTLSGSVVVQSGQIQSVPIQGMPMPVPQGMPQPQIFNPPPPAGQEPTFFSDLVD